MFDMVYYDVYVRVVIANLYVHVRRGYVAKLSNIRMSDVIEFFFFNIRQFRFIVFLCNTRSQLLLLKKNNERTQLHLVRTN